MSPKEEAKKFPPMFCWPFQAPIFEGRNKSCKRREREGSQICKLGFLFALSWNKEGGCERRFLCPKVGRRRTRTGPLPPALINAFLNGRAPKLASSHTQVPHTSQRLKGKSAEVFFPSLKMSKKSLSKTPFDQRIFRKLKIDNLVPPPS